MRRAAQPPEGQGAPAARARARARAKKRARERGIALVMVMGAIAILTVMLAEFQDETSAELAAATAERDGVQAEYMAKSAINLSRLLIASEPTMRKAIAPLFMMMKRTPPQLPVWEFSDRLLGAFNDEEASKDFAGTVGLDMNEGKNLGMPGGKYELVIVDEDAKVNVNLGAANDIAHIRLAQQIMALIGPPQYSPIFEQRDSNGQYHDRIATCRALIDWADVDEQAFNCDLSQLSAAQNAGVEDAWYQLQKKSYRRKNAPYDSLEELHMVQGVTDDFWATFVDPDPTNPKKRVITVWGQGAVNVNTANAQTLLGVVCSGAPLADICINPDQAALFLTGVTMARGITMGAPMFGSTRDFVSAMSGKGQLGPLLAMIGMKPIVFKSQAEFQKSITTESKMFSIYAVGVKKGYRRETRVQIHAVVDFRNAPNLSQPAPVGTNPLGGAAAPTTAGASSSSSASVDVAGIAANAPSTGGTVVYYRVE
jgi:general secretion pathway protein K